MPSKYGRLGKWETLQAIYTCTHTQYVIYIHEIALYYEVEIRSRQKTVHNQLSKGYIFVYLVLY